MFNARYVGYGVSAFIAVLVLLFAGNLVEVLPASDVMVIQYPNGKLEAFTEPGWYWQYGGSVTHYPKRESYEIEGQKIWFNDGGTALIKGNVQFSVPTDKTTLLALHSEFRSPDALMSKLIAPATIKAINASGSLMSSREAYAERRAELQHDIDDQLSDGTWQIRVVSSQEVDPLTKEVKEQKKGEVIYDEKGQPRRYEVSPLKSFGVKTFGLTVADITYDDKVAAQIKQQQDIVMGVQTARANALKAEQDVITTTKQGEATAAKAKWEKEAERAAATTAAQKEYDVASIAAKQKLEVAKLDAASAEQEKQAKILRGQGDAEARRLVLAADNALDKRGALYVQVQTAWANAYANSKNANVPQFMFGGTGANASGVGSAQTFMDLVTAKTARDLAFDPSMQQTTGK